MQRILTIEDDPVVAREIVESLTEANYDVEWVTDGHQGVARALCAECDLITLDRILPGIDGLTIVKTIRGVGVDTPVLMISALSEVDERVRGLRGGGDDYLAKPFSANEMVARVEVLLRRARDAKTPVETMIRTTDLEIDLLNRTVRRGDQTIALPPIEFRMLEYLARNAGQILTRTMIFQAVWDMHFDPGTNVIDVHIGMLRKKLDMSGLKPLIRTVRGAGYILE
ncbi:response regulator transcription factor [Pararobbsia silviterrae]|uniref:DNA-binding response regulator n=1 Tax=Pararobbsia silviterrae TaxID=1792498 RepID=A0A494XZQ0_9BURK|nr:response regulator transcription factor [Pararobbsia silviterrae]RKP55985.1 DNA-binding response regulator [Pararobbsia silviterrae]